MMKNKLVIFLVILILVAGIGLVLLKSSQNGNVADIVTPKPNYTTLQNQLVATFPDFPVYPGAEVIESRKLDGAVDGVKGYSADWEINGSKATVDGVVSWYKTQLVNAGWTLTPIDPSNNVGVEQYVKVSKGSQNALVTIETGEGSDPSNVGVLLEIPLD
jgi:hypothetical protein